MYPYHSYMILLVVLKRYQPSLIFKVKIVVPGAIT